MIASSVGRRDGAPTATSAPAPAIQPTIAAWNESNESGEVMNLVNASPHTAIQPVRRQRRPSHGAAAVNAAAIIPMPTAVGELAAEKGPASTVTATTWAPSGARLSCARSGTTTAARATPSRVVRAARRPLRTNVTTKPMASTPNARTRMPIAKASTIQCGSAEKPASSSDVNAIRVSPNSHCTASRTPSTATATTSRRTSAGERLAGALTVRTGARGMLVPTPSSSTAHGGGTIGPCTDY